MIARLTRDDVRAAAGNLLQAYHAKVRTVDGSQARIVADERFRSMCEVGAAAGLAASAGELEVMVADVAEQLPPPGAQVSVDGGTDWTWLMQARWLLARRLDPQIRPAAAA